MKRIYCTLYWLTWSKLLDYIDKISKICYYNIIKFLPTGGKKPSKDHTGGRKDYVH